MKKFFALCLASLMLSACGDNTLGTFNTQNTDNQPYAKNPNWQTIIVNTQGDYPPFSFKDEHGTLIGFERELLEAIATASEFNIDVVDARRSDLLTQLNGDIAHIWASAITVNAEHQADMELSEPYLSYARSVMILDNPDNANIKTINDLQGKSLSYNNAEVAEKDRAVAITKSQSLAIGEPSTFLAIKAVYTGKTTATISNSPVLQYYTMQYPTIGVRFIPVHGDNIQIAFAMKKGNTELTQKINEGLAKVKADGTYDRLVQKWFGQLK